MILRWTPDLSVGVNVIDDQHKELFKRVNALITATGHGWGKDELPRTLMYLSDYVVTHFKTEEAAMAKYRYPRAAAHRAAHAAFVKEYEAMADDYIARGARTRLLIALQHRVIDWLTGHVATHDKDLGHFLRSKPRLLRPVRPTALR
jgi:hemerythrin